MTPVLNLSRIFIAIFVSGFLGMIFLGRPLLALALCGVVAYTLFAFRKPILHLYVFLLAVVNFLGYLPVEHFFRLPGILKVTDLLFVLFLSIFGFQLFTGGVESKNESKDKHEKIMQCLLWVLFWGTFFQIMVSAARYNISVISTFKAGRHYLFTFVGLFSIYLLGSVDNATKVVRFLFWVAIIQSLLVILQNIVPNLPLMGYAKIIDQEIGSHTVQRIYAPAQPYVISVFFLAVGMQTFSTKIFSRRYLACTTILSAISLVLGYTRTIWFAMIIGLFMFLLFMPWQIAGKRIVTGGVVLLFVLIACALVRPKWLDVAKTRFESAFDETIHYKGNFAIRFEENRGRLDLIKRNILFGGPGFIHADDAPKVFNFQTIDKDKRATLVQTNDSGMLTWLLSYGLIGAAWAIILIVYLYIAAKKALRYPKGEKGILTGISVCVIAVWATCMTTTGFTFSRGVVTLSLLMYLFHAFYDDAQRCSFIKNAKNC